MRWPRFSSPAAALRVPLLAILALLAWPCLAADSAGRAAEKARIDAERSAVQARYLSHERECHDRFVVSACLADAKRERRAALDALRARQLVIDEAARRERAAERQAEIATKAKEDARRDQARAARPAPLASAPAVEASRPGPALPAEAAPGSDEARPGVQIGAPASAPAARSPHRATKRDRPPARRASEPPASAAETREQRSQREQEKREAFVRRQEQAQKHREAVAAQNAKAPGKARAALPLPAPEAGLK